MTYAPIIIPTLCRSEHFIRLIESLKRNGWAKYTDVFVGLDLPPAEKYKSGWQKICEYTEKSDFSVFKSFNVIKREHNLGGGRNIWKLQEEVLKNYDRYIMIQDDIEVAPNFIEFVDKCLMEYEDDPDVIGVTGYSYPVNWDVDGKATCMKQNICASVWGTGFWREKRSQMVKDLYSGKMLDDLEQVIHERRYEQMIDVTLREYIGTALCPKRSLHRMMMSFSDIGLRAYLPVAGKYFISPVISKTRNNGFDGSGVYCQTIKNDLNGNTAGTYNYSEQPIDERTTFELVLDTKNNLSENRDRLNRFDVRTPAQMRRTRLYLWLMNHFGIWAGKACAALLFPYDISVKVFRKLWRKLQK